MSEVGHMYRNGIKNIRFIDGRDNMLTISREEIATYDMFFKDEYVTNPALQNALISFRNSEKIKLMIIHQFLHLKRQI